MRERAKKLLSLFSVTALCAGMLVGCGEVDNQQSSSSDPGQESTGQQESGSTESTEQADADADAGPEEFTYPMDHVKLTLNYSAEENGWGSLSAEEAFSDPEKYLMGGIGVLSQGSGGYYSELLS